MDKSAGSEPAIERFRRHFQLPTSSASGLLKSHGGRTLDREQGCWTPTKGPTKNKRTTASRPQAPGLQIAFQELAKPLSEPSRTDPT